jgi:hypothetical protein
MLALIPVMRFIDTLPKRDSNTYIMKNVFEDVDNNVWLNLRRCVEDNISYRVCNNVRDSIWTKVYDNVKRNISRNTKHFTQEEL